MDSTPIKANTKLNNPKSFSKNKFSKDNQPKSDKDCKLGVYSASNDSSNKRYKFYWGYKNHIIVDAISLYLSLKLLLPLMSPILKLLCLYLKRLISGLTLSMLILLPIRGMMLREFIIMLEILSMVIVLFLETGVILKISH